LEFSKPHPENKPARVRLICDEPPMISELKIMIEKSERRISEIVRGVLEEEQCKLTRYEFFLFFESTW
jgi:hypothetical protein